MAIECWKADHNFSRYLKKIIDRESVERSDKFFVVI